MTAIDLITKSDLELFKRELFDKLEELKIGGTTEKGQWLRSAEVRQMLNISPGTLQNLRVDGVLQPSRVGKIYFYKREDILAILEKNKTGRERWER
ncbi:helix-turn-helix domain-containing protein [Nubsella zeaxanthinifaciens]|uniref:helix-turn-helix domain-containing protein n=1 Tax=Nubsella zeaxanthinifaciens TaxID=392412 RepID=UPI000DE223D4|nr:helix-turn-helix domain-containing protein [Nubsella zeaxanthinifaciens]